MAEPTRKKSRPSYNPTMLRWAREWRGLNIEEAGKKVAKTGADILAWETGEASPTVKQARALADAYGRSFIEFFRTTPPSERPREVVPDFRTPRDRQTPEQTWQLRSVQQWAVSQRLNTLDLFAAINEEPLRLPEEFRAIDDDDIEVVAERIRERLDFPVADQLAINKSEASKFPNYIRGKFERIGILTLKSSELRHANARGLCLAHDTLPVIVFTKESPGAQAFTLAHELGHVLLRQSAVSDKNPCARLAASKRPRVERWCDRFSAAFLMPANALNAVMPKPANPQEDITDGEIASLANLFKVSRHAMLIRLVNARYVSPAFYWRNKRSQYIAEEDEYESFGRARYYASRYRSSLGDMYTGLVIEAWSTGKITNHNASEFMGIKNIKHLFRIREEFAA